MRAKSGHILSLPAPDSGYPPCVAVSPGLTGQYVLRQLLCRFHHNTAACSPAARARHADAGSGTDHGVHCPPGLGNQTGLGPDRAWSRQGLVQTGLGPTLPGFRRAVQSLTRGGPLYNQNTPTAAPLLVTFSCCRPWKCHDALCACTRRDRCTLHSADGWG